MWLLHSSRLSLCSGECRLQWLLQAGQKAYPRIHRGRYPDAAEPRSTKQRVDGSPGSVPFGREGDEGDCDSQARAQKTTVQNLSNQLWNEMAVFCFFA